MFWAVLLLVMTTTTFQSGDFVSISDVKISSPAAAPGNLVEVNFTVERLDSLKISPISAVLRAETDIENPRWIVDGKGIEMVSGEESKELRITFNPLEFKEAKVSLRGVAPETKRLRKIRLIKVDSIIRFRGTDEVVNEELDLDLFLTVADKYVPEDSISFSKEKVKELMDLISPLEEELGRKAKIEIGEISSADDAKKTLELVLNTLLELRREISDMRNEEFFSSIDPLYIEGEEFVPRGEGETWRLSAGRVKLLVREKHPLPERCLVVLKTDLEETEWEINGNKINVLGASKGSKDVRVSFDPAITKEIEITLRGRLPQEEYMREVDFLSIKSRNTFRGFGVLEQDEFIEKIVVKGELYEVKKSLEDLEDALKQLEREINLLEEEINKGKERGVKIREEDLKFLDDAKTFYSDEKEIYLELERKVERKEVRKGETEREFISRISKELSGINEMTKKVREKREEISARKKGIPGFTNPLVILSLLSLVCLLRRRLFSPCL